MLHVGALLPDADAAGAAPLGRAQRLVRAPDQLVRVDRLLRVGGGHARAELQPQDAPVVSLVAQPAQHVLRHDPAVVERRVGQDHREARTTVAGDVIVAPEPRPDLGRDLPEHPIAGTPVQPLVDPAEVVGAEQEKDHRSLRLRGAGQGHLQLGLELRPIREPGHVVEERPGQGARMGGEGGSHAEEPLPPALVVERIGRRVGNPEQSVVGRPAVGACLEPHPDPGDQPGMGTLAPASLRAGGFLFRLQRHPSQRDPTQDAPGSSAGQADGPFAGVGRPRFRTDMEERRALRVGELRKRIEPAIVNQDLAFARDTGRDVERNRGRAAQPADEADVGPQDAARFAHSRSSGKGRARAMPGVKSLISGGDGRGEGSCVRFPVHSSCPGPDRLTASTVALKVDGLVAQLLEEVGPSNPMPTRRVDG